MGELVVGQGPIGIVELFLIMPHRDVPKLH